MGTASQKRHNYSKFRDTDFSGAWEKLAEGASDNADQTAGEINPTINVVVSCIGFKPQSFSSLIFQLRVAQEEKCGTDTAQLRSLSHTQGPLADAKVILETKCVCLKKGWSTPEQLKQKDPAPSDHRTRTQFSKSHLQYCRSLTRQNVFPGYNPVRRGVS